MAVGVVRQARPGAIETFGQERYVMALREVPEAVPEPAWTKDRAIGALLGSAVGDVIGTTLEFTTRDSYRPVTDIVGGVPFGLKAGQWTRVPVCTHDAVPVHLRLRSMYKRDWR